MSESIPLCPHCGAPEYHLVQGTSGDPYGEYRHAHACSAFASTGPEKPEPLACKLAFLGVFVPLWVGFLFFFCYMAERVMHLLAELVAVRH